MYVCIYIYIYIYETKQLLGSTFNFSKYQDIILSRAHVVYPRIMQLEINMNLCDLNEGKQKPE